MENLNYTECPQCDGTGKVDVIDCGFSASYCCGGCTKEEECDQCDGCGEIENEDY